MREPIQPLRIQGVKRVLYFYKILIFQTAPIKSYKLNKFLYFKPCPWKIQEIFKNLNKCLIGMEKIHNSGNFNVSKMCLLDLKMQNVF